MRNIRIKITCLAICFCIGNTLFANNINEVERLWYYYNRNAAAWLLQKDYKMAEGYYTKAKLLLEKSDAINTGLYVKTITDLGKLYYNIHDKVGFEDVSKVLDGLLKTDYSKLSKRGISLIRDIAQYYTFVGENQKANQILEQLIDISTKANSPVEHARLLHALAFVKYTLGDIVAAIQYDLKAIENSPLPESYRCLCWYYYSSDDIESLRSIISDAFVLSREPVLQHFVKSTGVERAHYWVNAGNFFNRFIPQFALDYPTEELCSIAYDAILLSKGMLLNADVTTADIIYSSGDESLIVDYNRLKLLSEKEKLTLSEAADKDYLQDLFVKKQKQFTNKFRARFRYSWKDIQRELKDGDVAIEFLSVGQSLEHEHLVALVVDKTCTSPYMIKLCSVADLSKIPSDELYSTSKIYNLIWQPILNKVDAVNNIYFSPASLIHNIAIEYSLDNDGMELLSSYNIHRLTSTRQIVEKQIDSTYATCLLLGGVNYNDKTVSHLVKVQGGVNYLPATKTEVDTINEILNEDINIKTVMLHGNEANESRVKKMVDSDKDIIHLATHGFYISSSRDVVFPSLDALVYNSLVYNSESREILTNDMSLTHSGLLLANANNTLLNTTIEEEDDSRDDGVLYASELAATNLNKTKLLVLSACETALGDLSFSEGVFGLQRGFKLAGGKSIIMSLWKIDDVATMVFMRSLYGNMKTMTLSDAFNTARMDLRMADEGRWDMPEFYNAFILMDAIN